MKKTIVWLLIAVLLLSLCGCITEHGADRTEASAATEQTEAPATEQIDYDITWQKAFRSSKYPAGGLQNDEVAFAKTQGGDIAVDNLLQSDLIGFDDGGYLPRFTLMHAQESEKQDLVPACISYALLHGYDRFVLPVNPENSRLLQGSELVQGNDRAYWWSIDIDCDINKANTKVLDDGSTVFYCLVVLNPPLYNVDFTEWVEEQDAAFEAAKKVVADMPEDCVSDYDKALYLYGYLTENVRYAYDFQYDEGEDYYTYAQNLYYDTLVSFKTVCAGYGKTFAWLCELAGLEAFPVTGQSGMTEAHLWTMVKIDDGYYWFDPTWDEGVAPERYCYFGISDEEMAQRGGSRDMYQAYEELLPKCPTSLPLPTVSMPSLTRGTITNGKYRNESLGLTCSLPTIWEDQTSGWRYLNDMLIGQGNGEAQTPFETLLATQEYAYDMVAINAKGEEIDVAVYRVQTKPDAFADILLHTYEQTLPDATCEKTEVTFCGETRWSIQINVENLGCVLCVFVPVDGAMLAISMHGDTPERCTQMLDYFAAIEA